VRNRKRGQRSGVAAQRASAAAGQHTRRCRICRCCHADAAVLFVRVVARAVKCERIVCACATCKSGGEADNEAQRARLSARAAQTTRSARCRLSAPTTSRCRRLCLGLRNQEERSARKSQESACAILSWREAAPRATRLAAGPPRPPRWVPATTRRTSAAATARSWRARRECKARARERSALERRKRTR
jgi:hypothetical protein